MTNLASGSLGSKIIFATDDFFAAAENMLNPADPKFDPNAFGEFGKTMVMIFATLLYRTAGKRVVVALKVTIGV